MTDKIFAPFSQATQDVLKLMLDIDASLESPKTIESFAAENDTLTVLIEMTGDIKGKVYYNFPKDTAVKMVAIMSGMEIGDIDDFVTSALGEMANIISGNAMTEFSQQAINCDILPPQVTVGVFSPDTAKVISASVNTDIGGISINITVD